jgi:PAS domain S-box-containing protein
LAGVWGALRLAAFAGFIVPVTFVLPLLVCVWTRDKLALWGMAAIFAVFATVKASLALPGAVAAEEWIQYWATMANIAIGGGVVHLVLRLRDRLDAAAEALRQSNEELAVQNEELAQQGEELAQQTRELQEQSEELTAQNEDLQCQSEEIAALNEDLSRREKMLSGLLASTRSLKTEREVLEEVCRFAMNMFGGDADGVAVLERRLGELSVCAGAGLAGGAADAAAQDSLVELVLDRDKAASVEDIAAAPTMTLLVAPNGRFRAALAAPMHIGDERAALAVYSRGCRQWTSEQFNVAQWLAGQCAIVIETIRLQRDLRHREARLHTIIESLDEGVVVSELDGTLVHWNKAALAMHGFTSMQDARRRLPEFQKVFELARLDGEVLPLEQWPLARILRGEVLHGLELRVRRLGSDHYSVLSYGGTLVRDVDGERLLAVVTVSDVTESKRQQELLRQSREDLERAQAVGQIGWWRLDTRANVLTWSPENHRIFGVPEGTAMSYDFFLSAVHPEDRQYVDTMWSAALRGEPYDIEHRIVAAGQVKWVREKAYMEIDAGGRVLGGFGITQDISARKRAEEALREALAKAATGDRMLAALMANVPEGISICGLDGKLLMVSRHGQTLLGRSHVGMSIDDVARQWTVYRPDGVTVCPHAELPLARALAGEEVRDAELLQASADGRKLPLLCNASPIRDGEGRVTAAIVVWRDISELKKSQAAMQWNIARAELLSQTAARLLESDDPQGLAEDLCRRVMEFLDCQVFFNFLLDEPSGRLRLNACGGVAADRVAELEWLDIGVAVCGCAARDRKRIIVEDIQHTQDSRADLVKSLGVRAYCAHPLIVHGRLTGTLSFGARNRAKFEQREIDVMQAVTHMVALAMHRVRTERELRQSEHFYRQTLESIPGMVFTARPDGHCDYMSQQWADCTGVASDQLLGDRWYELLHPDDRAKAAAASRAALHSKSPYDLECRVRGRDGEYQWFKLIARPIRDSRGETTRWFGVAADINQLKRAQEDLLGANDELRRTAQELSRSNSDLEQFAYAASHDLQEPLRMVNAFLKLLRDRYHSVLDEKGREYIEYSVDGATRMSQLVRDLLEYSRLGRERQAPVPVETQRAVDGALANLRESIRGASAEIIHDGLPRVMGDQTMLTQLFQNLISNAVKFRDPSRPCRVTIGAQKAGDTWEFAVSDNGIGIDPRHFERVFVIFQRLHTRDKFPGTGIGLALCKKIVERHGGRIWVESRAGAGTTFRFTLPGARQAPGPVEAQGAAV